MTGRRSVSLAVLLGLLMTGCVRGEHPMVARQPLAPDLDSGIALVTDGGIAAVALRDLSGAITDTCRPLMPSCDLERAAAPWTRISHALDAPFGESYVVLLTLPPGQYRLTSVTTYEGQGTHRIPLEPSESQEIIVPAHQVVLLGELACPGYRWRSCTPVWRGSLAAKRKTIDVVKWEIAERRGDEADLSVRRSWLPRLDAAYTRLTQGP